MSNIVCGLVQKRKVGSLTRKGILMFMASCASDDGSGVWASKATMARDLEMGIRTVQISIDDLSKQGLISEVGTRKCPHGYTIEYRLNLDAIRALAPTHPRSEKPSDSGGAGGAPVQDMHSTGAGHASQDVQEMHPNHPKTILEPSTRGYAREERVSDFERVWSAYPLDRRRGRSTCEAQVALAESEGVPIDDIVGAVLAYARETEGFTRSKVCYSDNWFRDRRWQQWVKAQKAQALTHAKRTAKTLQKMPTATVTLTKADADRLSSWNAWLVANDLPTLDKMKPNAQGYDLPSRFPPPLTERCADTLRFIAYVYGVKAAKEAASEVAT